MSTDTLQQPQADGASYLSKACPPPDPDTIDWFTNAVWAGLKQVADSDALMNFALLHEAAEKLPTVEQPAWRDLVRRLEIMVSKEVGSGHPGQFRIVRSFKAVWSVLRRKSQELQEGTLCMAFASLLGELNRNWFLPRSLLLHDYAQSQPPTDLSFRLWENASVALAETTHALSYPFADGAIPVYIVRHLLPLTRPADIASGFYDPRQRMVVIEDDYIGSKMYRVKLGAKADDLLTEYLVLAGHWSRSVVATEKQCCQWLDRRYPSVQDLRFCYSRRVLAEELRHAMDGMRAGVYVSTEEYYSRLVQTVLKPSGRLWQSFWEPVQSGKGEALLLGQYILAGYAISELSAQMTAAAVPDPGLVLLEWWRKSVQLASISSNPWSLRCSLSQRPEHTLANILGTTLLGEQLNCGPPLSWPMLCEPNFAALSNLAWDLMNRSAPELRLALQEVYRNEFNYPIDELPFAEILATGELRNRAGGQLARELLP